MKLLTFLSTFFTFSLAGQTPPIGAYHVKTTLGTTYYHGDTVALRKVAALHEKLGRNNNLF